MAPELRTVLSPLLFHEERTEEKIERILDRAAIWIWITANSYVRLDDDCAVEDRHEKQFCLYLTDTDEHKQTHCLSIHASTLEESVICLEYLVGLQDSHFDELAFFHADHDELRLCPFGANILHKILQNSMRRIRFDLMIFTPDHCRILASSGTNTNIEFNCCEFQDEGAAFAEASAARQDETSGLAKLRFWGSNPFNDRNLASFLYQRKLESLDLSMMELKNTSCRALAAAQIQCLTLGYCVNLEDEGVALVESVREGRGPKELCLHFNPFDSTDPFVAFMNALRGNTYLERLYLPNIDDRQVTQALAAALHENKGLVHLTVYLDALDDSDWTELLKAISLHPSLRSLDLNLRHTDIWDPQTRREFTKTVGDMLSVNERVQVMTIRDKTFDEDDWDAFVLPRLECNLYRERFLSIQKIGEASTRATVLARTLATFSSKPHLVWMLLNQNPDIVSSYLDSAHTSMPSQKRSRSPSLDVISAH
jgi:hypothetical protein